MCLLQLFNKSNISTNLSRFVVHLGGSSGGQHMISIMELQKHKPIAKTTGGSDGGVVHEC